jgi:hypothetical protein
MWRVKAAPVRDMIYDKMSLRPAADLRKAFEGLLDAPQSFDFKGLEMFWGAKP